MTVKIENGAGRIEIHTVMGPAKVEWRVLSSTRVVRPDDVQFSETSKSILIRCKPADGARIDLVVKIPHATELVADSASGSIALNGLVLNAMLLTKTGDINITTPWRLMRIWAISKERPREVLTPKLKNITFHTGMRDKFWAFANARSNSRGRRGDPLQGAWSQGWEEVYGEIRMAMETPGRLELADSPVPENSWVRMPADADPLLRALPANVRNPKSLKQPDSGVGKDASDNSSGETAFKVDVRLVTASAPVFDREGRPVAGLKAEDFELVEDGIPQQVAFARSEEVPFDLVLLLDLSKSAIYTQDMIKRAARSFVEIARPHDRVAIHVLANSLFNVMTTLTSERKVLQEAIEKIPEVSGGTPLYDTMVLSFLHESLRRGENRSALVVLSDGMDNQREGPDYGSRVRFERLKSLAEEWPTLIYPILVPYEFAPLQKWGKTRLEQLAKASGGRLFDVHSMQDLTPVYAQVAEELRAVYSVGYYPRNQTFDGAWRKVQVRVKRPGVVLRTRPGYFAN